MNQPVSKSESISKTYKRTFLTAMIIYAVVLLVSVFLTKHGPSTAWWRIPLTLVPLIPVFFALRAFLRFFSHIDELQRRIQLEALALSFGVTCVVTWSYGLLEYVGFPDVSWIWVPPFMLMFWSISVHIASQRYQ
ncbi:MAG TPA: hypothetical protein VFN35_06655 [Ktedonobacteraceae bacterium]|nr:hypothetical protein [Ktedonobacteraceae bacterium]